MPAFRLLQFKAAHPNPLKAAIGVASRTLAFGAGQKSKLKQAN
jgi:hypothetical protein